MERGAPASTVIGCLFQGSLCPKIQEGQSDHPPAFSNYSGSLVPLPDSWLSYPLILHPGLQRSLFQKLVYFIFCLKRSLSVFKIGVRWLSDYLCVVALVYSVLSDFFIFFFSFFPPDLLWIVTACQSSLPNAACWAVRRKAGLSAACLEHRHDHTRWFFLFVWIANYFLIILMILLNKFWCWTSWLNKETGKQSSMQCL